MKIQLNFTAGILTGICSVLLLFIITGTTTLEMSNSAPIYEFHDMNDTRGLIFNKVTGEIRYEKIREEEVPVTESYQVELRTGLSPLLVSVQ